jgi:hypothetical protein
MRDAISDLAMLKLDPCERVDGATGGSGESAGGRRRKRARA